MNLSVLGQSPADQASFLKSSASHLIPATRGLQVDALVDVAQSYLGGGPAPSGGDRYQVMLHVFAETLVGGEETPGYSDDRSYVENVPMFAREQHGGCVAMQPSAY